MCEEQTQFKCNETSKNFLPRQCLTDEYCICVYIDTGRIHHSSSVVSNETVCPIIRDNRTSCQFNRDQECPPKIRFLNGIPSVVRDIKECLAMTCSPVTGYYDPIFCKDDDQCFCVDILNGDIISGTEGSKGSFICSGNGEKLDMTECRNQTLMLCDDEGLFLARQCDPVSNECFCVFADTGFPIKPSLDDKECSIVHDNRTLCVREFVKGCSGNSCFLPQCDAKGNYKSMQCHGGSCYCVNQLSGAETPGIRLRPGTFWCDEKGTSRDIPLCEEQSQYVCDTSGSFEVVQCSLDLCFCVYYDTGSTIEGTESIEIPESCPSVRENRTTCQIARYSSCPKRSHPFTNEIYREVDCVPIQCRSNGEFYPMECSSEV